MTTDTFPPEPVAGYCRMCGTALTERTRRIAGGVLYCAEHVPVTVHSPAPPPVTPPADPGGARPGVAFTLGMIPGVGAIYNGQYAKGLIHAVLFGLLLSIASSDAMDVLGPLIGILIAAFWLYMAFEARHTALRRRRGEVVDEFSSLIDPQSRQSYSGALLLIFLGIVFLLNTLEIVRIRQLVKFWPVLLIASGISMLYSRIRSETAPPPPPVSPADPGASQEVRHE